MSIQYLRDRNQTIYIGLYNTCNSFCYYISAIQRLHSSTTLNKVLSFESCLKHSLESISLKLSSNDITLTSNDIIDLIISPLIYYARLNVNNIDKLNETHQLIKNNIEELIGYFDVTMLNGGNPDNILVTFLIPVLYLKFQLESQLKFNDIDLIKQIIKEINFNPSRLAKLIYAYNNRYNFKVLRDNKVNSRIEQSYNDLIRQLDVNMLYKDYSIQFNVTTISIYLQDVNGNNSNYAGHAVNLVYGYSDDSFNETDSKELCLRQESKLNTLGLYVIDDSTMIIPLKTYIQTHIDRIKYFEIQDVTDEVLKLISDYCEVNKRLHRDVIKPNVTKLKQLIKPNTIRSTSLIGGNTVSINSTKENQSKNNMIFITLTILLAILLVIVVVRCVISQRNLTDKPFSNEVN